VEDEPLQDYSTEHGSEVDRLVARFEGRWEQGSVPDIDDFLPLPGHPIRSVVLVELLEADIDYRVQRGLPFSVEEYVARYPELREDQAARLAALEQRLRRRSGPAGTVRAGSPPPSTKPSSRPPQAPPTPSPPLLPPELEAIEPLGAGGMGEVWRVRRTGLLRDRAVKLIHPKIALTPEMRERMLREARAMDRIAHPHAVIVHNVGSEPVPYIEMEYIAGKPLQKILQPGVPMALQWTARILDQLCDVLEVAHTKEKIVHRDLKPSNLMLLDGYPPGEEFLKVMDFGLAKFLQADPMTLTGPDRTLGTLAYMSPEQLQDPSKVDARSDIYSVGVLLYELLTGFGPFPIENPVRLMLDVIQTPAPPFHDRNPRAQVAPAIEGLVLRCLEKDRRKRPASAAALAKEFHRLVFPPEEPEKRTRTRLDRRWFLAAALPLVCLAGYGASLWFHPRRLGALPPDWHPAEGAALVAGDDGRFYPRAIERVLPSGHRGLRVVALFINPAPTREGKAAPFYIMRDKVWVSLFRRFANANPALVRYAFWQKSGDDELPVRYVTGVEAQEFARWLGGDGRGFLPTENQWDYAAGRYLKDRRPGPFQSKPGSAQGKKHPEWPEIAVGAKNQPLPVGKASRDISPFGCTDMSGNGEEWTRLGEKLPPTESVALRGASFDAEKPFTFDELDDPDKWGKWPFDLGDRKIGFRIVIELEPGS
jgi:serine/threonine protein kinase